MLKIKCLANSIAGIQTRSVRNPKVLFFLTLPAAWFLSGSIHVSWYHYQILGLNTFLCTIRKSSLQCTVYSFPLMKAQRGSLKKKAVLTSKNKTVPFHYYQSFLPHCKSRMRSDLHCWKLQKRYSTPAPGWIHYELLNCSSSNSVWKKKEKTPLIPYFDRYT